MPATEGPFEPVLLNLGHDDDYAVLVNALDEYADRLDGDADDDESASAGNAANAASFRETAVRARALRAEIERQLDANSAARRHRQD